MNRLRKTKGYSSKRMKPNSASVLTRIHAAMTPDCPMMNAHEPMNAATRSAMRSPGVRLLAWLSCQFLILWFLITSTCRVFYGLMRDKGHILLTIISTTPGREHARRHVANRGQRVQGKMPRSDGQARGAKAQPDRRHQAWPAGRGAVAAANPRGG